MKNETKKRNFTLIHSIFFFFNLKSFIIVINCAIGPHNGQAPIDIKKKNQIQTHLEDSGTL